MLKACKYCLRIHDTSIDCGRKPQRKKQKRTTDNFRNTSKWQRKRQQVRTRDLNLCQICRRDLYGTIRTFNSENLSVHHNVPIEEDETRALDEENLLTMCSRHHDMAERGEIPRDEVQAIINEQNSPPGTTKVNF